MASSSLEVNTLKQERAEIDTSSPFSSVKAAVSLFGERAQIKHFKQSSTSLPFSSVKNTVSLFGEKAHFKEKHGAKEEVELQKMKEELALLKLQLTDTEKAKEKAFIDLRDARKLLEDSTLQEHSDAWDAQVKVAQEQHMSAVSELGSTRNELENMKQEHVASTDNKETMIARAEEALVGTTLNAVQVEQWTNEFSGANESLLLCVEANEKGACFEAEKKRSLCFSEGFAAVQDLEVKLTTATDELIDLHQELMAAKVAEEEVARAASEAFVKFEQAKLELEDLRNASNISSCATSQIIKMAREDLDKALESGASLETTLQALQIELENMRTELEHLRQREVNASAAVLALRTELIRTKSDLKTALATEVKANEVVSGLSQPLEQRTHAAREAKVSVPASRGEASKARLHVDQAKSIMSASKGEVHAAIAVTEAAKNAALTSFKIDETVLIQDRQLKFDASSAISQEKHSAFEGSYREAEGWGYKVLVRTNAQVMSIQGGDKNLQESQETLRKDTDVAERNLAQETLCKDTDVAEINLAQETLCKDTDVAERNLAHEPEIIEERNDFVHSEAKHWMEKDMDIGGGIIGARALYEDDYTVSGDPWSYQMNYPVEEKGVLNQTSGHKKKRHFLSSLSSLLGRNSSLSTKLYTQYQ